MKNVYIVIILVLAASGGLLSVILLSGEQKGTDRISVLESLSDDPGPGYERAIHPVEISFPEDMGPHPAYQTEWWYYTGNIEDTSGRRFGYQLTFFRRSLSPEALETGSSWRTNQIYFAHFALTDVENGTFSSAERWSRDSLDLAGARAAPYRVWLQNWAVREKNGRYYLSADIDSVSLRLVLASLKPPALHGERGLSRKGSSPGGSSYYYSQTRLETEGVLVMDGREFLVTGLSWFDHEWSTSVLGPEQAGWDWFSIQLDDGREIMLYRLRLIGGGSDENSSGSVILADGSVVHLASTDFNVEPLDTWTSPDTGIRYPSKWKISIPGHGMEFTVTPYVAAQEHSQSFIYWEGAAEVTGGGFSGSGYVELTGYENDG